MHSLPISRGFSGSTVVNNPPANVGNTGSIPELGRSPGILEGKKWQPTPVFLPVKWTDKPAD